MHAAFGYDDATVPSHPDDQLELHRAVELEGREIAGVDADHLRPERDRAVQLVRVMCLDERFEAELTRVRHERRRPLVVDVAEQDQHRVGSGELGLEQVEFFGEEPLGEQRNRRRRPRLLEILERAPEALVDEDRHGDGAGMGELRR